jgi:hypothetical protein
MTNICHFAFLVYFISPVWVFLSVPRALISGTFRESGTFLFTDQVD